MDFMDSIRIYHTVSAFQISKNLTKFFEGMNESKLNEIEKQNGLVYCPYFILRNTLLLNFVIILFYCVFDEFFNSNQHIRL